MRLPAWHSGFRRKLLFSAMLAAFGAAQAEDGDEVELLIKPESSASLGLGALGDDKQRAIFGQYNGMRKDAAYLLFDFDVVRRDDGLGLWTLFEGRNLGLDTRELRFSQHKQGDWRYAVEYGEMIRREPRTVNTALQGAGTVTPTVTALPVIGTGTDLKLDLQRKTFALSGEKWITPNLLFEAGFNHEDKDGANLFGIGATCSNVIAGIPCTTTTGALLMLPEPVNSTTRQFEAKLKFSGEQFMLNGGYYGSFFSNANGSLTPSLIGSLTNPNPNDPWTYGAGTNNLLSYLQQPLALPPDNRAHKLYVSGNYAFTPSTRANFKYAYTHATQNESFSGRGLTGVPTGVDHLNGVWDTQLFQLGLTAHPLAKLTLLANMRYEDKKDKTPLVAYNGALTNTPNASIKANGKLEATYRLPDNYRATFGVDYASVRRARPVATASIPSTSLSGLREETQEVAYRAELQRSLSDTLNAIVMFTQSRRDGNKWIALTPGYPEVRDATINTATGGIGAFPMTLMDRKRDKLKASVDWTPTKELSLQFMLEDGRDRYTAPSQKGLHDTGMRSYGVDATLTLSENWKLTGYANRGDRALHMDHSIGYIAELKNITTSAGLGLLGKPSEQFELGADLSYVDDGNRYKQTMGTGAPLVGSLPDTSYRAVALKIFGKYELEKNADIRVDLVHQRAKLDEWSWASNGTSFAYSDNTSVSMQPKQNVTFLGARYIYRFR